MLTELFLSLNEYSRPGRKLKKKLGIIFHWVGKPIQSARQVREFFETDCPKTKHYSSAHYIIDFTGEIFHIIPDDEMAYHCGSSKKDPSSGMIYTNWAREKFGYFAKSENCSPNQVTIGIELCTIDNEGNFREATIIAAIELAVELCKKYNLTVDNIGTHYMVVGWKECPLLWTRKRALFEGFKADIKRRLENE